MFEVVLSAILGLAILRGAEAAQTSVSARYAGVLAAIGASFRKFGEVLKLQRLRKVWRDVDMFRSLNRQNESAEILSNRGLDVAHLPNMGKKGGNPDSDIKNRPADVYSPNSKNPNTIRDNMIHKVEHQAADIVLNIIDSPLSSTDILKFLDEKPVNGLKNLYLIDGEIVLLR